MWGSVLYKRRDIEGSPLSLLLVSPTLVVFARCLTLTGGPGMNVAYGNLFGMNGLLGATVLPAVRVSIFKARQLLWGMEGGGAGVVSGFIVTQ